MGNILNLIKDHRCRMIGKKKGSIFLGLGTYHGIVKCDILMRWKESLECC